MSIEPKISPGGEGRVGYLLTDKFRVKVSAEDSGGAFSLVEVEVPPGCGPPPHVHSREDETFIVLEGRLSFFLHDRVVEGGPGTTMFLPRGRAHRFQNRSEAPARALVLATPGGFERFLIEAGDPLEDFGAPLPPPSEAAVARLLEVAPRYGIEMLPPGTF